MIREIEINQGQNVEMEFETNRIPISSIQYRKYEVNPKRCVLKVGDLVEPETIIGLHHETGQPVGWSQWSGSEYPPQSGR
jgi:hypothetical protein